MKLFLIRHAESEHNILSLLAGSTDSALTNHGILQTQRLAKHLVSERGLHFTHIYASDLKRAYITAQAVADAQRVEFPDEAEVEVVRSTLIREMDFGPAELTRYSASAIPSEGKTGGADRTGAVGEKAKRPIPAPSSAVAGSAEKESKEAMARRAEEFIFDVALGPLIASDQEGARVVAVVSHGVFLATLWRRLVAAFLPGSVSFAADVEIVQGGHFGLWAPRWSNTGYLEIDIVSGPKREDEERDNVTQTRPFARHKLVVLSADSKEHLRSLKRTRGIGSETYDPRQKNIEGFFKKAKTDFKT